MRLKTINSILSKIGLLLVVEIDFNKKGFVKCLARHKFIESDLIKEIESDDEKVKKLRKKIDVYREKISELRKEILNITGDY